MLIFLLKNKLERLHKICQCPSRNSVKIHFERREDTNETFWDTNSLELMLRLVTTFGAVIIIRAEIILVKKIISSLLYIVFDTCFLIQSAV